MLICPLNFFHLVFLTLSSYYNFARYKRIKLKALKLMRGWEKEKRKEGGREGGKGKERKREGKGREGGREGEGDIKINYWLLFSMNCQKELFKIRNVRNFTTYVTIFKRISYF